MNSKQQGDVGVSCAIAYYTMLGCIVSMPLTDNSRYDLIVEKDEVLYRVQCKTTRFQRNGAYEATVKTSGGNQSWNKTSKNLSAAECDLLFIYSFDGKCYEFPQIYFDGKSSVRLGKDKKKYQVWEIHSPHAQIELTNEN